jgi:predicted transcriptional regulator
VQNYKETSRAAWESMIPANATLDRAIMAELTKHGARGRTCQNVEDAIKREHQAVSGNLRHLVEKGYVEVVPGVFGVTRSGRRAMLWRIIENPTASITR